MTTPLDRAPGLDRYQIRKWNLFVEEIHTNEARVASPAPLFKVAVAATIRNPYADEFTMDLSRIVGPSDRLGAEFGTRLAAALARFGTQAEGYGKGCIVGSRGEYEHGNAFLTSTFADQVRSRIGGGKAWIPSTGKLGGPGAVLDVPLAHKDALYVRSHYDTMTLSISGAPLADEVVVIMCVSTGGRLHARLGGLSAAEVIGQDGLR